MVCTVCTIILSRMATRFPFFFILFPSAFWFGKCIMKVKDEYFWRDKFVASFFPTLTIFFLLEACSTDIMQLQTNLWCTSHSIWLSWRESLHSDGKGTLVWCHMDVGLVTVLRDGKHEEVAWRPRLLGQTEALVVFLILFPHAGTLVILSSITWWWCLLLVHWGQEWSLISCLR